MSRRILLLAALCLSGCSGDSPPEPETPKVAVEFIGQEVADIYGASATVIKGVCASMSKGDLRLVAVAKGEARPEGTSYTYAVKAQLSDLIVHANRELTDQEIETLKKRIEQNEAPVVKRLDDLEAEEVAEEEARANDDPRI